MCSQTLERMYEFLEEQCEQKNKLKRALVRWAMRVGEGYQGRRSFLFNIKLFFARMLVLNAWRKALSSKIRYIIVGLLLCVLRLGDCSPLPV